MNILVTGGTGFIGEHFIPELLKSGHNVTLLVRNIEKGKKLFGDTCKFLVGDVTNAKSLEGCCNDIDIVYHMVAKVGNQLPSDQSFAEFRTVNVIGTKNIVEEAEKRKIKRFIFVSSIASMGIVKENPISENSRCCPYLPYQVTKFEAEEYLHKKGNEGFPYIIVRPTKVYGIGEHEYSYLTLCKLCKKGLYPKVGRGKNYTSNIYITDFVQALVKLVDNGILGETYIISSEQSIEFEEVGRIIASVLGKRMHTVFIPSKVMVALSSIEEKLFLKVGKKPIVTRKNIEATITDRIYDIRKAKKDIGYEPKVSMKIGIQKTVEWYKSEKLI